MSLLCEVHLEKMGCLPLNSEDDHAAATATDIGLVVSIWSHRREKTLAGLARLAGVMTRGVSVWVVRSRLQR